MPLRERKPAVAVFERMLGFRLRIGSHVWIIGAVQFPNLKDVYRVEQVLGKEAR